MPDTTPSHGAALAAYALAARALPLLGAATRMPELVGTFHQGDVDGFVDDVFGERVRRPHEHPPRVMIALALVRQR